MPPRVPASLGREPEEIEIGKLALRAKDAPPRPRKTVAWAILYGVARRYFRKPHEHALIDEAVQQTALQLYQYPRPEDVKDPAAYGAVACFKTCRKLTRREVRQRGKHTASLGSMFEDQPDFEFPDATAERDLELVMICLWVRQIRDLVKQRFGQDGVRLCLLIARGLGYEQIARQLGVQRRTVYNRLAAIRKLIEQFDPPPPERDGPGGGRPPPRGDPRQPFDSWLQTGGGRRVAVPLLWINLFEVEVRDGTKKHGEDSDELWLRDGARNQQLHEGAGMSQRVRALRARPDSGRPPTEARHEQLLRDFKDLLLSLPAFREAGLAPGSPPARVDTLREVFDAMARLCRYDNGSDQERSCQEIEASLAGRKLDDSKPCGGNERRGSRQRRGGGPTGRSGDSPDA
jgi:DNA-directed RNA polymerase specialized sigma24 family protein